MNETMDILSSLYQELDTNWQLTVLLFIGVYILLVLTGTMLASVRRRWAISVAQPVFPLLYPFWCWANYQAFLWSKGHGIPLLWRPFTMIAWIMLWARPLLSLWLFTMTLRVKSNEKEMANKTLGRTS
ncbi:MAG: hypothetical protein JJU29_04285 [Verrucomicrobia bacterium]|nr:hypothetical protein [Verrucomicrobiota bacterium]MCH8512053.1 hypothetical protein [Kiritimatiellia bacterium]